MRSSRNRRRPAAPGVSRRIAIPWQPLRAMLGRLLPWLIVSAGGMVAIALALPRAATWLIEHPYFAVADVEIGTWRPGERSRLAHGQPRLKPEVIEAWAAVVPGTPLFRVDPPLLAQHMEAHPWVRRATVTRIPPRRVRIEVREHSPLAIVRLDGLHYVNRRGALMGPVGPGDSLDLPVISGLDRGHGRTSLEVALPRVAHLLRRERTAWLGDLSEIHFDREHGVTLFPMDLRVSLAVGWDNWLPRLARARRVLDAWDGRESQLASIDLTGADAVIVRLRDVLREEPDGAPVRRTRV